MAAALEDGVDAPPLARVPEDRGARMGSHGCHVEGRAVPVLGRGGRRALALDRLLEEARLAQLRLLRRPLLPQGLLPRPPLPRPPLLRRSALGAVGEAAVGAEAAVHGVGAAVAHHQPTRHERLRARPPPLGAPHVDVERVVALPPPVALARRHPWAAPALAHVRHLLLDARVQRGLLRRAEDDGVGGGLEVGIGHLPGEIAG